MRITTNISGKMPKLKSLGNRNGKGRSTNLSQNGLDGYIRFRSLLLTSIHWFIPQKRRGSASYLNKYKFGSAVRQVKRDVCAGITGASSGKRCYLIRHAHRVIISKQVKHVRDRCGLRKHHNFSNFQSIFACSMRFSLFCGFLIDWMFCSNYYC